MAEATQRPIYGDLDDPNLRAKCPRCAVSTRVRHHQGDVFRFEEHGKGHEVSACKSSGHIVEDESGIAIYCIGHSRASRWESAMRERSRVTALKNSQHPIETLKNGTSIEVGTEWQIRYVATSISRYTLGETTAAEALRRTDDGKGFRPLYVAQYETRVLPENPTGVYLVNYMPTLDQEDEGITRNLTMLAVDHRFWIGGKSLPSIFKYAKDTGIKPPKYTKKELEEGANI